ncbi:MAG: patatin-like phospholipase family protein [Arenicellales bacterium]
MKQVSFGLVLLLLSGCASYGIVNNEPYSDNVQTPSYSIKTVPGKQGSGEITLILAFSGGGIRAAALAYGVLEELRDTSIMVDGRYQRILDHIDVISSVSGGSFTSAYYGLNGDRLFMDFERAFLRNDNETKLIRGLFNPLRWFTRSSRTEMAVKFYDDSMFHGASFADLQRGNGPLILINASDLAYGVRFTFTQEYFNLLCSDISSFPISRAVAASSTVPLLFDPVVVENYPGCEIQQVGRLLNGEETSEKGPELAQIVEGLKSYQDKDKRRYVHFVDGGITDNLGLRAIYDLIEVAGGFNGYIKKVAGKPVRRLAIISVNASTDSVLDIGLSTKPPTMEETLSAVTDVQLHRYNTATLELIQKSIRRWAAELSSAGSPVKPYFIQVNFRDIEDPQKQQYFNRIPTSYTLTDEQVDKLIAAGHQLLRKNPDYQRFITGLGVPVRRSHSVK